MRVVVENLGVYAEGFRTTVALTVLSATAAFLVGTLVAACRVSPVGPLRLAGAAWVEVIRNTPLTVLFVLFFFGLTKVGIRYSVFTSAVVVLSLYTSALVCEAVRSGINAVGRGQGEAARSLGLTFPQTLIAVVLPQALRTVVAPLGNLFIALTKNTSVASVISTIEITKVADNLSNETAQPIPILIGAGIAYLLLTLPSGLVFELIERRVALKR